MHAYIFLCFVILTFFNVLVSSISDGVLEVAGLYSSLHIARLQVNLADPLRIGQARSIKVRIVEKCDVIILWRQWWPQCDVNVKCLPTWMRRSNLSVSLWHPWCHTRVITSSNNLFYFIHCASSLRWMVPGLFLYKWMGSHGNKDLVLSQLLISIKPWCWPRRTTSFNAQFALTLNSFTAMYLRLKTNFKTTRNWTLFSININKTIRMYSSD